MSEMMPTREMTLDEWVDCLPMGHRARHDLAGLRARIEALEKAIKKALADEENGKWGPDVTVALDLAAALAEEEKKP